jgi:putative flippase GtrA
MLIPRRLLASDHLAVKVIRFSMVGVSTGIIYALVTTVLVTVWHVAPVAASILGYGTSVPISFLGHRQFTFRSSGGWSSETVRFVTIQALNVALTALVMHGAIAWLDGAYWWGMIAAVVLIPLSNFTLTNLWVFRYQATA